MGPLADIVVVCCLFVVCCLLFVVCWFEVGWKKQEPEEKKKIGLWLIYMGKPYKGVEIFSREL